MQGMKMVPVNLKAEILFFFSTSCFCPMVWLGNNACILLGWERTRAVQGLLGGCPCDKLVGSTSSFPPLPPLPPTPCIVGGCFMRCG